MFIITEHNSALTSLNASVSNLHFGQINSSYTKITGSKGNQVYLFVGWSGSNNEGMHLTLICKQGSSSSAGYKRDFGGAPFSSVSFSSNSYDITLTPTTNYNTLMIISNGAFSISAN